MLEIRPSCEHCNKELPNDSDDAMICSFECTFCVACVHTILHNVCPNCGGGFQKRPTRPKNLLDKYPMSKKIIHNPLKKEQFKAILDKFVAIPARKR